ncbi:MAG: flavodoxin family protein [Clostridia bacterium]
MKILAINSSFRGDNGYTKFLVDKLFAGASQAGAVCENINLAELKINHCIDCQVCQTEKHHLKCIHNDDAEMVFSKMKMSDIIIFATPIYVLDLSSLLKTLLERLYFTCEINCFKLTKSGLPFHDIDPSICSKHFVYLITCDNASTETTKPAETYFKTYSRFMDTKIVGALVRRTGALVGHGKDREREKMFPAILKIYDAFNEAGRELAILGKILPSTQRRANKAIIHVSYFLKYFVKLDFIKKRAEEIIKMTMDTATKR